MPSTRYRERLNKQKENSQGTQSKDVKREEIELINQSYAIHHQENYPLATVDEYCEMLGITKPQYKLNMKPRREENNAPAIQRSLVSKTRNKDPDLNMTEYLIYSKYLTMFGFFFGALTLLLHYIFFPFLASSLSLLFQSSFLVTKIRFVFNAANFIMSSACGFYLTEKIQATEGNAIFQKAYNDRILAQRAKLNPSPSEFKSHAFMPSYTVFESEQRNLMRPFVNDEPSLEIVDRRKRVY